MGSKWAEIGFGVLYESLIQGFVPKKVVDVPNFKKTGTKYRMPEVGLFTGKTPYLIFCWIIYIKKIGTYKYRYYKAFIYFVPNVPKIFNPFIGR